MRTQVRYQTVIDADGMPVAVVMPVNFTGGGLTGMRIMRETSCTA